MTPIDITLNLTRQQIIKDNGSRGIGRRYNGNRYHDPESSRKWPLKTRAYYEGINWSNNHHDTPLPLAPRVHVTIYAAYPKGTGRADPGNLSHTVKPIIDGLTEAGLWQDDDSRHLIGPDYRRESKPDGTPINTDRQGQWTIRIHIEEATS